MRDFTKEDIGAIMREAERMDALLKKPIECGNILQNRLVANMFFEPSTRTNQSFQAASARLGAKTLQFYPQTSSIAKGENFSDTIRMADGYADAIILRHAFEGAARLAADISANPVINAGDGANQHPTQTLIDLYTIKKLKGRIFGLKVALFGDLRHARTMHSLLFGLSMFGAEILLISPPSLSMDNAYIKEAETRFKAKITAASTSDLSQADILYVCRVQKERFRSQKEAKSAERAFKVDEHLLHSLKEDLVILHPLPRVSEISPSVDSDPRAKYFDQAKNGVPVRMAVLASCILNKGPAKQVEGKSTHFSCKNKACILRVQPAPKEGVLGEDGVVRCSYCEQPAKKQR